jgi:hypothetical protein
MKNPNNIFKAILFTFTLLCATAAPKAFAVVPAPDGGYPGFNTAEGQNALKNLSTGQGNTAAGWFSLFSATTGSFNTGVGAGTLALNTGDNNTATGAVALFLNTTGSSNTAVGAAALLNNTTGGGNTATGAAALSSNSEGSENTATGAGALISNTTGSENTANGQSALFNNTTGTGNTASGFAALLFNDTGSFNTAVGPSALLSNVFGDSNTAAGYNALHNNNGPANVALGAGAGYNATTGSGNVYVGAGMVGVAGESNACYIASIFGQTSADGVQVYINSNNKLGTLTSSKRFKEDIEPMDKASEALFALKPVTFRYKKEIDPAGRSQFGLVAEEVDKVNPDLVVHDKDGKAYSVRYDQVNAMLLNEFLKEHKKVEEQQATMTELKRDFQMVSAQQQNEIQILSAQLKEQAAQIQKVSAQVQMSQPATKVVLSNP